MKSLFKIFLIMLCVLVMGCNDKSKSEKQYINNDRPGDTAKAYFDALYNQKDLQKAMTMAMPQLSRIMESYGTAKQFSRSIMNLQYDEVVLEIDMSNSSLREQYGDKAKINVIFTGYLNGKKIDDMRSVNMLKIRGKWYIKEILADPYAR